MLQVPPTSVTHLGLLAFFAFTVTCVRSTSEGSSITFWCFFSRVSSQAIWGLASMEDSNFVTHPVVGTEKKRALVDGNPQTSPATLCA